MLKLSGEALASDEGFGSDPTVMGAIADQIKQTTEVGFQLAIVVGGGNYFRGGTEQGWGIPRAERDNVGILGTVMNGIFLRGALLIRGVDVRLMTAVPIPSMGEPYIRLRADNHLNKGRVVVLAGGNGQPYVTTDYPAVQRAVELSARALLVAKNGVAGIMTADPKLDASATLVPSMSYDDALDQRLKVMDQAAFVLAMEHRLPLKVFDVAALHRLTEICQGENIGTIVQ